MATAIATSDDMHIWNRGYEVTALMTQSGFTQTIFLLHQGRLPTAAETGCWTPSWSAWPIYGAGAPSCATARLAASGNRQSLSAARWPRGSSPSVTSTAVRGLRAWR